MTDKFELIVDKTDNLEKKENVFFVTPERLNQLKVVSSDSFYKATIRNCPVNFLTSFNLQYIYNSLKKNASATVFIDQPILVMQDYDKQTIQANATLAGFTNIKTSTASVMNEKLKTKIETIRDFQKLINALNFFCYKIITEIQIFNKKIL